MTRLINNKMNLNSLRELGSRSSFLTAVLVLVIGLTAGATQAQDPEVGNGGWTAEKSVDDYMNASSGEKRSDADFDYAGNTLRTEVWVDQAKDEIYRKGQDISVGFQTNQDAYAVVYRIDTDGVVTVLWPRSRFDDGFIFGSHEYQLPVSGARKLQVSTSEGQGIVEAVVSEYPFDLRALELDFHHEHTAERYDFRVAGDPFLAMNEVNFAVTGLEDSGEYVVTNYASYYVHQEVDHPRYLCSQCHIDDEVAYDPYQDDCTLSIEYDYSWYNGWYDNYGYYPVYGNPVFVYIDPWNYNPWVNYWYQPYYSCAPWGGWGWGYGGCYSWNNSPYYGGNCATTYYAGNTRYRPLDRTRMNGGGGTGGAVTKTREYGRGSEMVRKNSLSPRERGTMESRTRSSDQRADRSTTVGRSGGRDVAYRGAEPSSRTRSSFVQTATTGRSQGGLRIRESGNSTSSSRSGGTTEASRRRHTAAGEGQRAGLVPVTRNTRSNDDWRGTSRVGGTSSGRGSSSSPTTVGNSRRTGTSSSSGSSTTTGVQNSRNRGSSSSKTVQPRQRNTRVWNSTGSRSNSSGSSSRSRSGTVNTQRRNDSGSSRSAVKPRSNKSSGSKSTGRSSGAVKKSSNSSSKSSRSSGSSRSSKSSGSSRSSGSSKSSSSGSRSGSSRR